MQEYLGLTQSGMLFDRNHIQQLLAQQHKSKFCIQSQNSIQNQNNKAKLDFSYNENLIKYALNQKEDIFKRIQNAKQKCKQLVVHKQLQENLFNLQLSFLHCPYQQFVVAQFLCSSQICKNNAIICGSQLCKCYKDHFQCKIVKSSKVIQKISKKIQSPLTNDIQKYFEAKLMIYQYMIERISLQREQFVEIYEDIKNGNDKQKSLWIFKNFQQVDAFDNHSKIIYADNSILSQQDLKSLKCKCKSFDILPYLKLCQDQLQNISKNINKRANYLIDLINEQIQADQYEKATFHLNIAEKIFYFAIMKTQNHLSLSIRSQNIFRQISLNSLNGLIVKKCRQYSSTKLQKFNSQLLNLSKLRQVWIQSAKKLFIQNVQSQSSLCNQLLKAIEKHKQVCCFFNFINLKQRYDLVSLSNQMKKILILLNQHQDEAVIKAKSTFFLSKFQESLLLKFNICFMQMIPCGRVIIHRKEDNLFEQVITFCLKNQKIKSMLKFKGQAFQQIEDDFCYIRIKKTKVFEIVLNSYRDEYQFFKYNKRSQLFQNFPFLKHFNERSQLFKYYEKNIVQSSLPLGLRLNRQSFQLKNQTKNSKCFILQLKDQNKSQGKNFNKKLIQSIFIHHLKKNQIQKSIIDQMYNLKTLFFLHLKNIKINQNLGLYFNQNLKKLKFLAFQQCLNLIDDYFPQKLEQYINLEVLIIQSQQFNANFLWNFVNLKTLHLNGCTSINDKNAKIGFYNLLQLVNLELRNCALKFTSWVSQEVLQIIFQYLKKLKYLNLENSLNDRTNIGTTVLNKTIKLRQLVLSQNLYCKLYLSLPQLKILIINNTFDQSSAQISYRKLILNSKIQYLSILQNKNFNEQQLNNLIILLRQLRYLKHLKIKKGNLKNQDKLRLSSKQIKIQQITINAQKQNLN